MMPSLDFSGELKEFTNSDAWQVDHPRIKVAQILQAEIYCNYRVYSRNTGLLWNEATNIPNKSYSYRLSHKCRDIPGICG